MQAIHDGLGRHYTNRATGCPAIHHASCSADGEPSGQILAGRLLQQWLQDTPRA